ncbi:hypothetical protein [Chryseobacterium gossypii]
MQDAFLQSPFGHQHSEPITIVVLATISIDLVTPAIQAITNFVV